MKCLQIAFLALTLFTGLISSVKAPREGEEMKDLGKRLYNVEDRMQKMEDSREDIWKELNRIEEEHRSLKKTIKVLTRCAERVCPDTVRSK